MDELAVTVERWQALLVERQPQIVHFYGHGRGQQGLVSAREEGGERSVETEALSNLLKPICEIAPIQCVLLNACYSEAQANVIVHIDYVIGMQQEIQDKAAITFSKSFYRALGYDCITCTAMFENGVPTVGIGIIKVRRSMEVHG